MGTLPTDTPNGLAGNILIITAPTSADGTEWLAKAKDHMIVQYGNVTCYAVICPASSVSFV